MYRVLIVDDEKEIRNGYARFFPWENHGFEVAGTANDGIMALEFLSKEQVDVILCDIIMPRMDGLTLAEKVRIEYPNIEIIILSDHQNFEYARQAMKHNINHYVLKSDKHAILLGILAQIERQLNNTHAGTNDIIQIVRQYLKNNLQSANLQSAADEAHISQHYLSRLFKEQTGENFNTCLIRLKIEKACEMLQSSDIRVSEVSEALGYSDPKNFNRVFKKVSGMTPRDYRRHNHHRR